MPINKDETDFEVFKAVCRDHREEKVRSKPTFSELSNIRPLTMTLHR